MAGKITYFAPEDKFGINALLDLSKGDPLYWEPQSYSSGETQERASGLGGDGDEVAHRDHGGMETITVVYTCFGATGTLLLPNVGAVVGGYHIDSIALPYNQTGWPTMTVTGHKHLTGSTHTLNSTRQYKSTLKLPAGYCVPNEIKDVDDVTSFKLANASIGVASLNYELRCTHIDDSQCGNWLAGENHDGVETLSADFTGQPEAGDLTIAAGWSQTAKGKESSNTGANSASMSLEKHIKAHVEEEE